MYVSEAGFLQKHFLRAVFRAANGSIFPLPMMITMVMMMVVLMVVDDEVLCVIVYK